MKEKLESILDLIRQAPVAAADETCVHFMDRYHAWRTICAGVAIGHIENLINSPTLSLRKVEEKELKDRQEYLITNGKDKWIIGVWKYAFLWFESGSKSCGDLKALTFYELPTKP